MEFQDGVTCMISLSATYQTDLTPSPLQVICWMEMSNMLTPPSFCLLRMDKASVSFGLFFNASSVKNNLSSNSPLSYLQYNKTIFKITQFI